MKKSIITAGGFMICACMLLAACAPQVTASVPDVLTVQIAGSETGAGTASLQADAGGSPAAPGSVRGTDAAETQTVTVTAAETVKIAPDMARIIYEITTEDKDAEVCQQKNSETLDAVIAYLKEQGVAEKSIQTSDFSLNPQYEYPGNGRQVLVGYEMDTQLTVSDIPMDQVGELLTGAVSAGVSRIRDVSYYASGYDEAYDQALALAMDMAKEKAEAIAHAGGCQVTDVLSVTESADRQSGRYVDSGISQNVMVKAAAEDSAAEMAVMAGEMEIEAEITVVYRLLPR